MKFARFFIQPLPTGFPKCLAGEPVAPAVFRRKNVLLCGLVLFCLIPRILMAWSLKGIADDGFYYLYVADALKRGDLHFAFSYLNLNIYPCVLVALNSLGLELILAAKVWGVVIGSLTVLPMFGWIRRLFNEKVALVACMLYSIHPEMIELSVEPIREATFWFLTTLVLYFSSRALIELKWTLFILLGLCVGLAIHTRSEGWLLLVIIIGWSIVFCVNHSTGRRRVVVGTLISMAITPLLLVAVNLTLLRNHDQWEWGRMSHFHAAYHWLVSDKSNRMQAVIPSDAQQAGMPSGESTILQKADHHALSGTSSSRPAQSASPSEPGLLKIYLHKLVFGIGPFTCILLAIGLFNWRHLLIQQEIFFLCLLSVLVLLVVWIRFSYFGSMNSRYFLPIFLFLVPFISLGLLRLLRYVPHASRRWETLGLSRSRQAACFLVLLSSACWIDAISSPHRHRESREVFGLWLKHEFGPFDSVIISDVPGRVGYVANGKLARILSRNSRLSQMHKQQQVDLVILSKTIFHSGANGQLREDLDDLEFYNINTSAAPGSAQEFTIFVRKKKSLRETHSLKEASLRRKIRQ